MLELQQQPAWDAQSWQLWEQRGSSGNEESWKRHDPHIEGWWSGSQLWEEDSRGTQAAEASIPAGQWRERTSHDVQPAVSEQATRDWGTV